MKKVLGTALIAMTLATGAVAQDIPSKAKVLQDIEKSYDHCQAILTGPAAFFSPLTILGNTIAQAFIEDGPCNGHDNAIKFYKLTYGDDLPDGAKYRNIF